MLPEYINAVRQEIYRDWLKPVHELETLPVLLDLLLEKGLLTPAKRRRQGKRGTRSARNFMLRKARWFALQYRGPWS